MGVERLESGLTWRAMAIVAMAALVFVPASTYLYLVTGATLGVVGTYAMMMIFAYIMRMLGFELRPQEVFVTYVGVAAVAGLASTSYFLIIYRMYFVESPIARSYYIGGVPLYEAVPEWLAPPLGSRAYLVRTFFQPDLVKPIAAWTVAMVLTVLAELSLVILASHAFVEVQKLPFPFAQVDATIVTAISSGERFRELVKYLMPGFYTGLVYGLILYLGPFLGFPIIPLPFIDLTRLTSATLPGAVIGVATSLTAWVGGMVVPLGISSVALATSVAVWVLGNYLILTNPSLRVVFPEWGMEYYQGMDLVRVLQRSQVRVWLPIQIGAALGFAALVLAKYRRAFGTTARAIYLSIKGAGRESVFPPLRLALALYLAATLTSVAVFHYLIPGFPLAIPLVMSLVVGTLMGFVSASVVGESGASFSSPPFLWHTIVYLTPAQHLSPREAYSAFVYPPVIAGSMTGGGAQVMKAALLTGTKPSDVIKVWILAFALGVLINLLSLDMLWRIAPIPSSAYPSTVISMPATAMIDALLVTRGLRIEPGILMGSAAGAVMMAALVEALAKLLKVGVSSSGLLLGLFTPPVTAIPMFTGSALGWLVLRRRFKERWEQARYAIVAGTLIGEGLAATIAIIGLMLSKASWLWPW
ncbi:MAG: OPT/YSL family transporter [Thermofilaceae archaeon]